MTHDELLVFLVQIALLLLTALALGQVAARLGMPTIVGELLAGVLIGPPLLTGIAPSIAAWLWPQRPGHAPLSDVVGQVGLLLFVGLVGAHLDVALLRRRRGTVVTVGASALVLPLLLGVATGFALPDWLLGPHADRLTFALLVGVVMSVSAIPVIAKTLADLGILHREVGQLTVAAAVGDDTVAWLVLAVVAGMTADGEGGTGPALILLRLVGFLLAAAVVGRPLVRAALRRADRAEGSGPVIATTVVLILGGSAASLALGLEAALGAFVAGLLVNSAGAVPSARLAPLRVVTHAVLAPIFLASAGLQVDLSALASPRVVVVAAILCTVAVLGKFAGAHLGARLSRLPRWEGLAIGAGLNARGAVEVVVASIGLRIGVLSETMYTLVVLVAILTSVMAPLSLTWIMRHHPDRSEEWLGTHDADPGGARNRAEPD
jgi:Kef-type K+ transport system membrane component KefB